MFQRSASKGKEAWTHMLGKRGCGHCELLGNLDPGRVVSSRMLRPCPVLF